MQIKVELPFLYSRLVYSKYERLDTKTDITFFLMLSKNTKNTYSIKTVDSINMN